jgi:hypothetical protein
MFFFLEHLNKQPLQWAGTGMRSFPPLANLATPTLTSNSTSLQVAFLNLMANLVERAGWVQVRVGGNSQESAELVSSLPNGTMLAKDTNNTSGPTSTPPLEYTLDLLYTMANISKLTNTHWYLGWLPRATLFLIFEAHLTRHPLYHCQYAERLPGNHGTWPEHSW